jgi:hypothetical protein
VEFMDMGMDMDFPRTHINPRHIVRLKGTIYSL